MADGHAHQHPEGAPVEAALTAGDRVAVHTAELIAATGAVEAVGFLATGRPLLAAVGAAATTGSVWLAGSIRGAR